MPEGDTILRTATSLQRWLGGRTITDARSSSTAAPPTPIVAGTFATTVTTRVLRTLIGEEVEQVEARGKHLLIRFSSGRVLHTHMRMHGSWHVYPKAAKWSQPARQARVVLESGDRIAVCFRAPVVELLRSAEVAVHRGLTTLGPDVLAASLDLAEIRRRMSTQPPATLISDLLLDQRIISGVGNIYRSEALFLAGLHPDTAAGDVSGEDLDDLLQIASRLMREATAPSSGLRSGQRWVYGRTARACRRCGGPIRSALTGATARRAYWCPRCQPAPGPR